MKKLKVTFAALTAMLVFSCSSTQIGLKENWIDERDMMALKGASVNKWMETAGRPTLVEINGDTSIYYYNYKPTMYAVAQYDSTTFITTWGKAKEIKPGLANAAEVWGSRKDIMQIKVVNDVVITATITEGPDKKVFVRDLNGELILDPNSGYNPNVSDEQKIGKNSDSFDKAHNSLNSKNTWNVVADTVKNVEPPPMNPWEDYRYRQQKSEERAAARAAEETQTTPEQDSNPPAEGQ
ncbi:MAG: hypothetical protein FWC26_07880 [Fibromonadales bacterium]|nr:hypothetical protein [Fibromonadales bacterium]